MSTHTLTDETPQCTGRFSDAFDCPVHDPRKRQQQAPLDLQGVYGYRQWLVEMQNVCTNDAQRSAFTLAAVELDNRLQGLSR